MGDEAREYIRAAQAAEIKGDKAQAVELLRKAATLYKSQGNGPRALQMLRHARRLDGQDAELADELSRMEWIPDRPMERPDDGDGPEKAVALLDEYAATKTLIERGPTRADPALAAWCSFCCRPKTEVGDLVAGPAGAFICAGCVRESGRLLGGAAPPAPAGSEAPVGFVGQDEAVKVLEAGMRLGARAILVLGAPGTGKTTYLRELENRGLGTLVKDASGVTALPEEQRVLVDLDGAENAASLLDAIGKRAVIAVSRGEPPSSGIGLAGDEAELPVYASQELIDATGGTLTLALAERVQVVASFRPPTRAEMEEIARRHLARRAADLDLSDDVVAALAEKAMASPRQGHELRSLVDRIPSGSWNAKPAAAKKRRRKK